MPAPENLLRDFESEARTLSNLRTLADMRRDDPWPAWNAIFTSSGTSSTLVTASTGSSNDTVLLTSSSSVTTWTAWNNAYYTTITCDSDNDSRVNTAVWTAWNNDVDLRHASEERVREAVRLSREQYSRVEAERQSARDRAERLLRENLSAKQKEELQAKGYFTLELLSKGQRKLYRIERGRSRNVRQVDDSGRVLKTLCAHPVAQVPDADTMLAQKFMLESAEEEFLRIANHS